MLTSNRNNFGQSIKIRVLGAYPWVTGDIAPYKPFPALDVVAKSGSCKLNDVAVHSEVTKLGPLNEGVQNI